ncbi:hypothetical protein Dimus_033656, partial [Dionaea muscipula]
MKPEPKKQTSKHFPSISEVTFIVDEEFYNAITKIFPISLTYRYFQPLDTEMADNPATVESIAIYYDHLLHGFRFPLYPFIVDILNAYNLIPAQLHANSSALIIGFVVQCLEHHINLSLAFFHEICYLKEVKKDTGYWMFSARKSYHVVGFRDSIVDRSKKFIMVNGSKNRPFSTVMKVPHKKPEGMLSGDAEKHGIATVPLRREEMNFYSFLGKVKEPGGGPVERVLGEGGSSIVVSEKKEAVEKESLAEGSTGDEVGDGETLAVLKNRKRRLIKTSDPAVVKKARA